MLPRSRGRFPSSPLMGNPSRLLPVPCSSPTPRFPNFPASVPRLLGGFAFSRASPKALAPSGPSSPLLPSPFPPGVPAGDLPC